ncbi:MAG TPA: serine/threonine protein kinase, partial [Lentzea sp.]
MLGGATLLGQDITRVTRKGETLGSPAYVAPEQLTSNQVSPLTDLYALGCLLHELLVGTPVFGERETMAMMYAQVHEPPRPVREVRPDVPEPIERLVFDLLAKEPETRPADAGEVYTRLTPYLPGPSGESDAAFEAIDPTRPYRFPLAPKPRPRLAQA